MPILGVIASSIAKSSFTPSSSYDAIYSTTLASAQSSIDFTGLDVFASNYKHLQVRYFIPSTPTAGDNIYMRFGYGSLDAGSNYWFHNIQGYYSSTGTAGENATFMRLLYQNTTQSAAYPVSGVTDILEFGSSSKNKTIKTFIGRDANSDTNGWSVVSYASGIWLSTNPITNLRIAYGGGNLPANTRVAIYGIRG